jgi:hypothetical protein
MRLFAFIIMLGFASAALAQSNGSVQGQVMDPTVGAGRAAASHQKTRTGTTLRFQHRYRTSSIL